MIMRCVVFELALTLVREERKQTAMMAEFKTEVSDGDPESATRREMAGAEAGARARAVLASAI